MCLVGPMVGRNHGFVTTQGEILSDYFIKAGYQVISVSSVANRYARLLHIIITLLRDRSRIDLVMLQTFGGPSFIVEDIASAIVKLVRKKVILHLRGGAMPEFTARFPKWTLRVLSRADMIVVPSNYLARLVQDLGFRNVVIPNVIDIKRYNFKLRKQLRPRLFWMRSFHPIYNPMMAIRTLAKLRLTFPDANLVMGGQDKDGHESNVRRLVKEFELGDFVRFVGFMDLEMKLREGKAADIFINTNSVDNTPVSVIEACAMGLPVVSTDVGGIPDLLTEGETALLVPVDDHEAMSQALIKLLTDQSLAERLSANGRRLAETCSWNSVLPQWGKLISEILN